MNSIQQTQNSVKKKINNEIRSDFSEAHKFFDALVLFAFKIIENVPSVFLSVRSIFLFLFKFSARRCFSEVYQ